MALYDDYLTHDDKPFVENINDALLLSNVFDMTVQVDAPEMFSNQTWVNTTSPRKCSVSVLQLKEALPSGVSVSTSNNKSVLTGTGTVKLGCYPNFNAFGKYKSISWTGTGTIKVNLKTTNGATIANDIANGTITSESVELRKLQEIVIEIVLSNATLTGLSVVMENKQSTRYGATVGITDVTGLNDRLNGIESEIDSVCNLSMSASDYTTKENTTITIYCYAKDIEGNPIQGKELTPYGVSGASPVPLTTKTTDNNGMASWSVTVAYGLNTYYVEDATLQIYGYGYAILWQNSQTNPTAVLYRNNDKAILVLNGLVTAVPTSWAEYGSNIASTVAPKGTITSVSADHQIIYSINWEGKLQFRSLTGSTLSNKEHYIQIEWSII